MAVDARRNGAGDQPPAWLRERFENGNNQDLTLGAGYYGEWIWHGETSWAWNSGNPLQVGWTLRRVRDDGFANRYQFNPFAVQRLEEYRGAAVRPGAYVQQGWSAWQGRLHGGAPRWAWRSAARASISDGGSTPSSRS